MCPGTGDSAFVSLEFVIVPSYTNVNLVGFQQINCTFLCLEDQLIGKSCILINNNPDNRILINVLNFEGFGVQKKKTIFIQIGRPANVDVYTDWEFTISVVISCLLVHETVTVLMLIS